MKGLSKRLEALEATQGNNLSHMSDEAIDTRIAELTAQIDTAGGLMHPDWRGMMARGEYRALYDWEMQCALKTSGSPRSKGRRHKPAGTSISTRSVTVNWSVLSKS